MKINCKDIIESLEIFKTTFGNLVTANFNIKDNTCSIFYFNSGLYLNTEFPVEECKDLDNYLLLDVVKTLSFLKSSSAHILEIKTGKTITFISGNNKLSIPKANETPVAQQLKHQTDKLIIKSADSLLTVSKYITPFAENSQFRALQSIQFTSKDKVINLIGTDSFRVGKVGLDENLIENHIDFNIVVPVSVFAVLERLNSTEKLYISLEDKNLYVSSKINNIDINIGASTIEVEYPDTKGLLSNPPKQYTDISLSAVRKQITMHKNISGNSELKITFGKKQVTFSTICKELLTSQLEVLNTKDCITAGEVTVATKYLLDSFNLILLNHKETVSLGLTNNNNLLWIVSDDTETLTPCKSIIATISK